jgi:6-phosphogluconolactonase
MKTLITLMTLSLALTLPAREFFVFFGTYTNALSRGIYVARLDAATGSLTAPELAAESPNPSYLAISPGEKYLYAANEVSSFGGEKAGAVSAFALERKTGRLTFLNQKSAGGDSPCHLSTDSRGTALLLANYGGGSVKSFQLNGDGSIGADGSYILHHGASVNPDRQTAPHAHAIYSDPANRFALACDLGLDKVMIYRLDSATGNLAEHSFATVPPGSGPRHLAFSANGKFIHVLNEMGCTVSTFAWDSEVGKMELVETTSVLPPGLTAQPGFTAAEIVMAGKYAYATIRGHDSVSVFTADARTGRLQFLQNVPSWGKVPRGLGVDPTGRWLLAGNQNTDNVVEFAINPQTGMLSPTGRELKIGSPVDVKFVAKAE